MRRWDLDQYACILRAPILNSRAPSLARTSLNCRLTSLLEFTLAVNQPPAFVLFFVLKKKKNSVGDEARFNERMCAYRLLIYGSFKHTRYAGLH